MPSFADWKLDDVHRILKDAIDAGPGATGYEKNLAYVEEGDHWQGGAAWIGPAGTAATRGAIIASVEPQFTPHNAIGEALENATNGLLQREADVDFVLRGPNDGKELNEAQQRAVDDMKRIVSAWWDRKHLWRLAKDAYRRSRWAGRGALRLFLAPGNLAMVEKEEQDGSRVAQPMLPSGLKIEDAFGRLDISAPLPGEAHVYTDPASRRRSAIFSYHEPKDDGTEGPERAELWYVDGDDTVFRILGSADDANETYRVPMDGRLPIVEMESDILITESVRRQQNRLNFYETVLVRVGETAGFPERYTLNAEPSGLWLKTPPTGPVEEVRTHTDEGGATWYLHTTPRTLGASVTTDLRGLIDMDDAGALKRATPGVVFKEPTDPDYAIRAANHGRSRILQSCKQGHLALENQGEASGIAYEQARAGFEADLRSSKGAAETMIADLIEAAIAWVAAMSRGEATRFLETYRCVVTIYVTAGPVTAAQQMQNNANVEAGTLSLESAMAANGVEDVDAELQKIAADPSNMVALREKQAEIIGKLLLSGQVDVVTAALFAGIEKDDPIIARLEKAAADAKEATANQRWPGEPGSGFGNEGREPGEVVIPGLEGIAA